MKISDKNFELYISGETLRKHVKNVARKINDDLRGENPIFVGMLNGAFMFFSDLMKEVEMPCEVSFVRFSSYSGTASTGEVKAKTSLDCDIEGRTVVIVEDIVETGLTMAKAVEILQKSKPKQILIATMFFKPNKLKNKDLPIRYVGMEIGDEFVVGYGLDYNEYGRNLGDLYKIVEP